MNDAVEVKLLVKQPEIKRCDKICILDHFFIFCKTVEICDMKDITLKMTFEKSCDKNKFSIYLP